MKNHIFKFKIIALALALSFLAVACNTKPVNPVIDGGKPENQPVAPLLRVTEIVEGSDLAEQPYELPAGQNALNLLKIKHQVQTKTFAGVGEFVEAIDGVKPDSQHFWAFYVNGKSSDVGASGYQLRDGDKIEWKLEKINTSGQ